MIITCKALLDSLLGQGIYHSISYKGASGGRGCNTWLLGCCRSKWEEFFLASDSNRRRATVLMFSFLQNCRPTNSMAFIPPIISLVGGLEHDFFILQMLGIIILTILTILTDSYIFQRYTMVYHQYTTSSAEDLVVKPLFFAALFGTMSSMVLCCRPDVKRSRAGNRGNRGSRSWRSPRNMTGIVFLSYDYCWFYVLRYVSLF